MKCPTFDQDMKKGFLPVIKGRLYWAPDEEKVPWSITQTPKGSVVLF